MTPLKIVFMGSPAFAVPALKALAEAGHEILMVYTQPPRPAGRGQVARLTACAEAAGAMNIPVRWPTSLKTPEAQADFQSLDADVAVVAAYGLILPRSILQAPRLGCVNIHASLLPRWRGAAPIERAILTGDMETGITIMMMEEGLDTGPMILSEPISIRPHDTGGTLHDRLAELGARLIVPALEGLADDKITPMPQPASGATYASKIKKEETQIDWRLPAEKVALQVRAFNPWPGAWTMIGGRRVKVLEGTVINPRSDAAPGYRRARDGGVVCGDGGIFVMLVVQPEGKRPMDFQDYLNGIRDDHTETLPCPVIS